MKDTLYLITPPDNQNSPLRDSHFALKKVRCKVKLHIDTLRNRLETDNHPIPDHFSESIPNTLK